MIFQIQGCKLQGFCRKLPRDAQNLVRVSFVPRCPYVCKWLIRMPLYQLEIGEHHRRIWVLWILHTLRPERLLSIYQVNLRIISCLFLYSHGNNWGGLWVSSRFCDDHVEGMASNHFVAASVLDAHEELENRNINETIRTWRSMKIWCCGHQEI